MSRMWVVGTLSNLYVRSIDFPAMFWRIVTSEESSSVSMDWLLLETFSWDVGGLNARRGLAAQYGDEGCSRRGFNGRATNGDCNFTAKEKGARGIGLLGRLLRALVGPSSA